MKIPIESLKKTEYSINIYGALDVRLFPNKRLNVDLKNIEIGVSHCLKQLSIVTELTYCAFFLILELNISSHLQKFQISGAPPTCI